MSYNKEEFDKVNGNGAISANDEAENKFYIVWFTSAPYTLQEYVESDGNQLASGDLVCNTIYTFPGRNKSQFYVNTYIYKRVTVSMKTVAIGNLDIKVWTQRSNLPQGN